jgi:hypothetical protein
MKLSGNDGLIENTHVRSATLVVLVLALVGGFCVFAQSGDTNLPLDQPNGGDATYPGLPGVVDTYPSVVAYVDGHAIALKLLAFRVYALEQNQSPNVDTSHPVREALHGIIQDQILIDHASDYGVTVSYNEARVYTQQAKAALLSVPEGRASVAPLAQQMGVSVDDYFELLSTIQGYREGILLGKMRQYVWSRAAAGQFESAAGEQAALDAFTDHIHANVQILIDVP